MDGTQIPTNRPASFSLAKNQSDTESTNEIKAATKTEVVRLIIFLSFLLTIHWKRYRHFFLLFSKYIDNEFDDL